MGLVLVCVGFGSFLIVNQKIDTIMVTRLDFLGENMNKGINLRIRDKINEIADWNQIEVMSIIRTPKIRNDSLGNEKGCRSEKCFQSQQHSWDSKLRRLYTDLKGLLYKMEVHLFVVLHQSKHRLQPHKVSFYIFVSVQRVTMSQSTILTKEGVEKSLATVTSKMIIKIPQFDNSALVQGYSRKLIGRCMNPRAQNINNLLFMLPRIWNVEERVVGADLGMGRFQFDFDEEDDIVEVL